MKKLKLPTRRPAPQKSSDGAAPKAKRTTLPSSWRLYRTSLHAYLKDWKLYTKILALVAVPSDLLGLSQSLASNAFFSDYTSMAAIVMNVASLWSVIRRREGGLKSSLGEAYYDGNVALIRYTLVTVILVAMLIPLALGISLYGASLIVPGIDPLSVAELLIALGSIILAVPTFFFLVRMAFAPIITVRDGLRPFASVRRSWHVTRGHFWPIFGRFILLMVFLALTSIPATIITVILSFFGLNSVATVAFEIIATLTALPILNLYLLELYRDLEKMLPTAPAGPEAEAVVAGEAAEEPDAPVAVEGESGSQPDEPAPEHDKADDAKDPEPKPEPIPEPDAPAGAPA